MEGVGSGGGGSWREDGAGLVFKVHRLVYLSTLGLRVIQKKKKDGAGRLPCVPRLLFHGSLLCRFCDLFFFMITLKLRVD